MAVETCGMCLLEDMDRLWFHQFILFSEKSLFIFSETPKAECLLNNSSQMSAISDQEISPLASVITSSQVEASSQKSDHHVYKETTTHEERPTRLNPVSRETRSQCSSPISAKKQSRNLGYKDYSARKLQKTKSLGDLELEEVKGFMDLGFIFKKEDLGKQMMSLIPGLRRINSCKTKQQDSEDINVEVEDETEEEKRGIMRPYLSEAWLIKRPDSPLLSLRIPRVCATSDMKKHLKFWARAVASAIQQES